MMVTLWGSADKQRGSVCWVSFTQKPPIFSMWTILLPPKLSKFHKSRYCFIKILLGPILNFKRRTPTDFDPECFVPPPPHLCDLDLWPFAWTPLLSLVITTENFMMIRWWEHSEKGVTDRQMDWTIHRAAWLQLKRYISILPSTYFQPIFQLFFT